MSTHDDKLMFPAAGIDKHRLIRYYTDIADVMTPHVCQRFLTLRRFPDGIDNEGFYQQRRPDHYPDTMPGKRAPTADGSGSILHIMVENPAADLRYLADQAAIELHGWLSHSHQPDRPDRIVFDLDPDNHDFRTLVDCAQILHSALDDEGLAGFVMTTGSRGLHVVAPLDGNLGFDDARRFARQVAGRVVDGEPRRYTIEQRKSARRGRLYIDTSRNAYGQTSIIPYSLRALPDAPVATPLDWDELGRPDMGPRRFRLSNIFRRLAQKPDPWRRFFSHAARPGDRP